MGYAAHCRFATVPVYAKTQINIRLQDGEGRQFTAKESEDMQVFLYNVKTNTLAKTARFTAGTEPTALQVGELPRGQYILKVVIGKEQSTVNVILE